MKKAMIVALMMMSQLAAAQTKVLECAFTEPFFSLTVDLVKKEISKTEPNWEEGGRGTITTVIARNIMLGHDLSDVLAPTYVLIAEDGSPIADFKLDMQGSDGMSDIIFPYSMVYENMHGGCSSDVIKEHNPHQ